MKQTTKVLLSAVLTIALCVSVISGATFALFTSEASTNIAVTAGKVNVEASVDNLKLYSMETYMGDNVKVFANGGTADYVDGTLTLDKVTPGDKAEFSIVVTNSSNVDIQYRVVMKAEGELASAIVAKATINGTEYDINSTSDATEWVDVVAQGAIDPIAMSVELPATVGNEYQEKSANVTITLEAVQGNALTSTEEVQAALDNAVPGTTIYLTPGVDYGVLYLRPSANAGVTKEVDWVGNNYRYETYSLFEDLTIVGAEGATVKAIEVEGGTYYNTAHSQSNTYPVMLSLIELKNVVFDGVTFTGKGGYDPQGHGNAVNLSGNNIKVDGLTFKNCVLDNDDNNARLLYKTESTTHVHTYTYDGTTYTFVPSLKDITVTGCTFNGGYMGLELRETENLTITNNTFNGVTSRDILIPANVGYTYSGTITITGNTSNYGTERFVRASGIGNATLVIKDNVLNGYMGEDDDYIKVEGNTGSTTIENNPMTRGYKVATTAEFQAALGDANVGTIFLSGTVDLGGTSGNYLTLNQDTTIVGGTIKGTGWTGELNYAVNATAGNIVFDGVTFDTTNWSTVGWAPWGISVNVNGTANVTFKNCTFKGTQCPIYQSGADSVITLENCKFETTTVAIQCEIYSGDFSLGQDLIVKNCDFTGVADVLHIYDHDKNPSSEAIAQYLADNGNTFTGVCKQTCN